MADPRTNDAEAMAFDSLLAPNELVIECAAAATMFLNMALWLAPGLLLIGLCDLRCGMRQRFSKTVEVSAVSLLAYEIATERVLIFVGEHRFQR